MVCDLVKFYEGGLTFEYAYKLSYHSLCKLSAEAGKISVEIKRKMDAK